MLRRNAAAAVSVLPVHSVRDGDDNPFCIPILVLLGCVVFYRERLTVKKSVCAALCLLGILFFYTPGESGSPAGVALAFASGVTYALYVLYYSKSGLAEMNTFKLSFYLSLVSSAGILAGAVLSGKIVYEMPPQAWLLSVLFAFIVSVVATVSFQAGTAGSDRRNPPCLVHLSP